MLPQPALQFIVDQVQKVLRIERFHVARLHLDWRIDRGAVLPIGQKLVLAHQVQHAVAALLDAVRIAERIVVAGPLHHTGQHGRFRQVQLRDVFTEVGAGGLAEAVDAECAEAAQIDLVCIVFEDLLLGQLMLQVHGDEQFLGFAFPVLVRRQPQDARKLHAQGGRSLLLAPGP